MGLLVTLGFERIIWGQNTYLESLIKKIFETFLSKSRYIFSRLRTTPKTKFFLWCVWLSHIQIWFNDLHDLLMNKIVNWTRFMLKHHFVWDDFSWNEWKPLWHQYHISIFNLTVHFSEICFVILLIDVRP